MVIWVNVRKLFCIIGIWMMVFSLCACQKTPAESVVTKKDDGTTDYSTFAPTNGQESTDTTISVIREDRFQSTDKSVEFIFNVNADLPVMNMPVVRIAPDYLSEDDAKRVANVLFGNTDFYEAEPMFAPSYSKEEIQEKISRWSPFTNSNALLELYGQPMDHVVDIVHRFIEDYTLQYESAPNDSPHELCRWKFRKSSEYRYSDEQIREEQINTSVDNDEITASLRANNIEYQYNVATRNEDDYKLNYISAFHYTGISPNGIDTLIINSKLCRTDKPTDDQISYVYNLADSWLKEMELGEWNIDQCEVKTTYYGDIPEYVICVTAVPVLQGIPAIRYPQLENLKSENVYASNYYYTDAYFEFSANGDLILFTMYSPIEIKEVVSENATILGIDELLEKAKTFLELSDLYAYGIGPEIESLKEKAGCTVEISNLDMGLTRIKVPNSEDYDYVPSVVLKGNVEYYDRDSKDTWFASNDVTLLVLNAMDGSIISTVNK